MFWRWSTATTPGKGSRRKRPWTAQEIRRVKDLVEAGYAVPQIAKQLRRTTAAVEYKARVYGVKLPMAVEPVSRGQATHAAGEPAQVGA